MDAPMFVVIEWNQASGMPGLPIETDLFHDRGDADAACRDLREQAEQSGRGETYRVAEVYVDMDQEG